MIKFTAFRTTKPRQFNYIPRYYDPEQEAREERKKQVLGTVDEPAGGEYVPGQYIRGNMRSRIQSASKAKKKSAAPARFLIMLVLFGIVAWLWLDNVVILVGSLFVGFVAWRILSRK